MRERGNTRGGEGHKLRKGRRGVRREEIKGSEGEMGIERGKEIGREGQKVQVGDMGVQGRWRERGGRVER